MTCPLCRSSELGRLEHRVDPAIYLACGTCDLRFLHPEFRLSDSAEKARYDTHRYAYDDAGYAGFVAPLMAAVAREVPTGARGMDFGAGRLPVLARWLTERGYGVVPYDPFYWPDPHALDGPHDFVVSCEVIEHLFEPAREFRRLRDALAPGAPLLVMTEPWRGAGEFHDWYYRRDPTHVSFYTERTFRWIADAFGFKTVTVAGRVVCYRT